MDRKAMLAAKRAKKLIEDRVSTGFRVGCDRIPINMFLIGDVLKEGRRLVAAGASDSELVDGMRAFALTIASK